jgi:hypothetical protein
MRQSWNWIRLERAIAIGVLTGLIAGTFTTKQGICKLRLLQPGSSNLYRRRMKMIDVNVVWSVRSPLIQQRYKCKEIETWKQSGIVVLKGVQAGDFDTVYVGNFQRIDVHVTEEPAAE